MNNANSPEYFVAWVKEKFFNLNPKGIHTREHGGGDEVEAIKSWLEAGEEYKDNKDWIALKVYIYLVCYSNGIDLIDSSMDFAYAKQILSFFNTDPLTPLALTKIPKSIESLKDSFMQSAQHIVEKYKFDDQTIDKLFVIIFSAYSVLLQNRLSLDSFRKKNRNEH